MILIAAVALTTTFAAGVSLGAWGMWRHTEIDKMQLGSLIERDVEKVADDTGQDLIVAALPAERSAQRGGGGEDWPPFPHESFSDRRELTR